MTTFADPAPWLVLSAKETLTLGLAVQELHAAFGPGDTYLFGSRARGTPHAASDMDVLHVPTSKTAPQQGVTTALHTVESRVQRRGGTLDLGIQIVPEHLLEDAVFEYPFLKTAQHDMLEAKALVVAQLHKLPQADILRAQLAHDRPQGPIRYPAATTQVQDSDARPPALRVRQPSSIER